MNTSLAHERETWNPDAVRPLFSDLRPRQLHLESVLAGGSPGRLFVDRIEAPSAAVVLAGDACYVGARSQHASFLRGINPLLPRDRYTAVFHAPDLSPRTLEALVDGLYMTPASRWHGSLRGGVGPSSVGALERCAGADLRPVDQEVLSGDLIGLDDLRDGILSDWKTLHLFIESGFGHIAVVDGRIVGRSTSDYVVDGCCEIGVWVSEDHRRQGLGTSLAASTANEALSRGLHEVLWHCWANNAGSIGVATNVGFEPTGQYGILFNHWAAENISDMPPEGYRTFALDYERRFAQRAPRESGYPRIVAATAWQLGGDDDRCRQHLHAAIDIGWLRGIDQLRALWPELLESGRIYRKPAWLELLARLDPSLRGQPNDAPG